MQKLGLFLKKHKQLWFWLIALYMSLFLLTNFIFFVFSPYLSKTIASGFIAIRDILVIFFIFIFAIQKIDLKKIPKLGMVLIVLIIYILLSYLSSPKDFASTFYFRAFVFPWLFFIFGFLVSKFYGYFFTAKWFKFLYYTLIVFSGLSILIYIFQDVFLNSTYFNLYGELAHRGYNQGFNVFGNAISYELRKFTVVPAIRLASLFFDPPIAGIFFSLFGIFLFLKYPKKFLLVLPFIAGVLTLTKGFWFVTLLFIPWSFIVFFLKNFNLNKYILLLNNLAILTISFVFALITIIASGVQPSKFTRSIYNHTKGLSDSVKLVIQSPLGTGIGTQGNIADQNIAIVKETYWGAFIAQFGILGVIILFEILKSVWNTFKRAIFYKHNILWLYSLFFFVYLISAFLSESSLAIRISSVLFFTYGLVFANVWYNKQT